MNISKAGAALGGGTPAAEDLTLIRRYARRELTAEEVYTFPVILCDNEVDRDYERFDEETLGELAEKFTGKTGISDHEWRSAGQVARIYRTELIRDPARRTAAEDGYVGLKAHAYMLRSEANAGLIADIEGGIKKEVSVGCSVRESLCSICGKPIGGEGCVHARGETYGGKLCYATLHGAADAYEWSFVAVPAQRGAGVTKALEREKGLAGYVERAEGRAFAAEYAALKKDAALGLRYLSLLRAEVKRLSLVCGREFYDALTPGLEAMDADALEGLRTALERRAEKKLLPETQLPGGNELVRFDGEAYLV